jgi:citronellol/citronellal dehydrogenase
MADAAYAVLSRPGAECTGNFFIDEEVLRAEGVNDFSRYGVGDGEPLQGDFFIPDAVFERSPTRIKRGF